ncbi:MAG: hypothetical protein JWL75_715, partial [Parcubacteria group bacterium]|nr:hypothetical protein [Parcubacteria group bacterium]
MSERKSWDVQRKPSAAPARNTGAPQRAPERVAPAPVRTPVRSAPTRAAAPVRSQAPVRSAPRPELVPVVQRSPRRVAPQPLGALSKRRKQRRRTMRYVLIAFLLIAIAAGFYALWRPALRIQAIETSGPGLDSIRQIVGMNITGTYFHILPKNSILFYPKERIRAAIIDANPDVSAVSLKATSFSSIAVKTTSRAKAFVWCGTALDASSPDGMCYQADIEGFIFMQDESRPVTVSAVAIATASTTSTSTPAATPKPAASASQTSIQIYGPLDKDVSNGASPIRAHVVLPGRIPEALKFVDALRELGA